MATTTQKRVVRLSMTARETFDAGLELLRGLRLLLNYTGGGDVDAEDARLACRRLDLLATHFANLFDLTEGTVLPAYKRTTDGDMACTVDGCTARAEFVARGKRYPAVVCALHFGP